MWGPCGARGVSVGPGTDRVDLRGPYRAWGGAVWGLGWSLEDRRGSVWHLGVSLGVSVGPEGGRGGAWGVLGGLRGAGLRGPCGAERSVWGPEGLRGARRGSVGRCGA